ncbi:DUF1835 domain-containing protein [Yersinia ruckeri]|nr:DUF1835 domain-containing protein [Yersinia ruckeri]
MNNRHIALWGSATGGLRAAFHKDKVISFNDNLSYGPLYDVVNQQQLSARLEWVDKMYRKKCVPDWREYEHEARISDVSVAEFQLDSDEEVTVWIGDNADEQLMLMALLPKLALQQVAIVNVTDEVDRKMVALCPIEMLVPLWQKRKLLSPTERQRLIKEWTHLHNENAQLHVYEHGVVVGKDPDFYDHLLFSACTDTFTRGSRVIGDAICASPDYVEDTLLDYRMRIMADNKLLILDNPKLNMNKVSVKLA